ncbi:MAG TPA: MarR family winged helix-turn-helix transcriptional regulator [Pseudonocardiaceae bacterium]|nr:MarR family winged helix-turn-helix transcriptional regulator [Pseudonocardiaceae bacterium]
MPDRPGSALASVDGGDKPLIAPLLRQAYRWFSDAVAAAIAARGVEPLSLTQIDLFAKLDVGGTTIAELARRSGIARQSAHQAVGELVKAGLLRVDPDPTSARNKLVRPTSAGTARLRLAKASMAEVEQELVARIGERAVEQLRTLLDLDWPAAD